MTQWEYKTVTLRVIQSPGKMAGFFNRQETARIVDPESEKVMQDLGSQGWELVSVTMLDYGTYGAVSSTYAGAFFKRPRA